MEGSLYSSKSMASSPRWPSILTGSLGLTVVFLTTLPAAKSIAYRFSRKKEQREINNGLLDGKTVYQDEDGHATEESERAFSDKWQKVGIAFLSVIGFLGSLALAVITKCHTKYFIEFWLQFGVWVCLELH